MLRMVYITARTASALHILVKDKELADDIITKLKKGTRFDVLTEKYSSCPSAKKGGNSGEFKKAKSYQHLIKSASAVNSSLYI